MKSPKCPYSKLDNQKKMWLFYSQPQIPQFLCPSRSSSSKAWLVSSSPLTAVLYLSDCRPLPSWSSLLLFLSIFLFSLFISFHGPRQDPSRSRSTATVETNSMIGSSWVTLKVIKVKCVSNATIQSCINNTNDSWDSTNLSIRKWGIPLSWLN